MTRLCIPLILLGILSGSIGCRMCGSQYDYCMPAYTQRGEDYRGCDPMYRAGSVFNSDADYSGYFQDPDCPDCQVNDSGNAGNFGQTEAIKSSRSTPNKIGLGTPSTGKPDIGIPPGIPSFNGEPLDIDLPPIQDLMDDPIPNTPTSPRMTPIPTIPKEPEPIPFTSTRGNAAPNITVDDLKRLDPSVTDVKILNIEDSINSAYPKDAPQMR